MSERSARLAKGFEQSKERQAVTDAAGLQREKVLDEGFSRMRTELKDSLKKLCDELTQEPEIGDLLVCKLSDEKTDIMRTDIGSVLTIKFDPFRRSAVFNCDKPAKFRFVIEVKPTTSDSSSWYADVDGRSIRISLDWVAEKSLSALLGVAPDFEAGK
jgi:hypothetical protein